MKSISFSVILIVPGLVSAYCQLSRNRQKLLLEVFLSSTAANEWALFCRIYKHFIHGFDINVITGVTSSKSLEYILIEVYKTGSAKWFENSPHGRKEENLTLAVKKKGRFQNLWQCILSCLIPSHIAILSGSSQLHLSFKYLSEHYFFSFKTYWIETKKTNLSDMGLGCTFCF